MPGKQSGIGIVSLIAGVVIGGYGYKTFFATDAMIDIVDTGPGGSTKPESATDLAADNERLHSELAALHNERTREKLAAVAEKLDDTENGLAEVAAKMGVQFNDPKFQDALASIDWDVVGASMKDMVPLMAMLAEQLAKGEEIDLAVAGEVQKLNGELLKAAQKIMEGKIPGTGVNGSFTHPAVVANQFAAALKAAGLELNEEQRESMDRIMKFYSSKDESLRLADHESSMQTLAEEVEFKDAFYKEVRGLLSEEQQAAIFSKGSEGRLGLDMFDSTLMLEGYAKKMPVADANQLATMLSTRVFRGVDLDAAGRKQLDAILTRWSHSLPADFWSNKADALDRKGIMSGSRVRAALKRQSNRQFTIGFALI